MYVTVVGIDRYRAWSKLQRAVNDACGARDAFVKLGFKELRPPLLDEAATGAALHRLATDELRVLGREDSLVVFFAGHGHTATTSYSGGMVTKLGYLVPVDAAPPGEGIGSLVGLDSWLHDLAHLPPKHILVVIDACHSGIALNPVIRWRGEDVRTSEPLAKLRARRSRRIITSALDNELAMDSGPIEGHSLFTGCLIEALTGGLQARTAQSTATGSEIALHVQRRVSSFPGARQTPDFGALELDDRGELIVALSELRAPERRGVDIITPTRRKATTGVPGVMNGSGAAAPLPGAGTRPRSPAAATGVDSIRPTRARTDPPVASASAQPAAVASARAGPAGAEPIAEPVPADQDARSKPSTR